jgi:energy-coupling factor transport system ATP-binding protein
MELQIDHLGYTYHPGTTFERKALDDICLTIGSGEFIGMIGHTGSGKSTLVQHMNGLIKATEGRIFVDGMNIYEDGYPIRELRCRVGLVFQYPEYQLFDTTVLSDVCFGPKNKGLSGEEAKEKAREAMRAVGLDESYEMRSPFELSGGQKRRAAIAGILAMDPELLVLDEPTAGMDPEGRDEILHLLKKLHEERGISIVLVSHSMEDVANYVSRIVVLDQGKVLWDDIPSRVFVHVEELEKIGLAAPQVSYIMAKLAQTGWDVDPSVTTIDAAAEQICKVWVTVQDNLKQVADGVWKRN